MEIRTNVGYRIVASMRCSESEVVLGHNPTSQRWVTWNYNGANGYFWGHYFKDEFEAREDFIKRATGELRYALVTEEVTVK